MIYGVTYERLTHSTVCNVCGVYDIKEIVMFKLNDFVYIPMLGTGIFHLSESTLQGYFRICGYSFDTNGYLCSIDLDSSTPMMFGLDQREKLNALYGLEFEKPMSENAIANKYILEILGSDEDVYVLIDDKLHTVIGYDDPYFLTKEGKKHLNPIPFDRNKLKPVTCQEMLEYLR